MQRMHAAQAIINIKAVVFIIPGPFLNYQIISRTLAAQFQTIQLIVFSHFLPNFQQNLKEISQNLLPPHNYFFLPILSYYHWIFSTTCFSFWVKKMSKKQYSAPFLPKMPTFHLKNLYQ